MKTIFLDCDGVLAQFADGALKAHGKSLPKRDIRWDFPRQIGFEDTWVKDFWDPLNSYDFWRGLDEHADGMALWAHLENVVGEERIGVLTSALMTNGCIDAKRDWILHRKPSYKRRIFTGSDKFLLSSPTKILVDDHEGNIDPWAAAGGPAVLVPRSWNKRRDEIDEEGNFDVAKITSEVLNLL